MCGVLVLGGGSRCPAHKALGKFGDRSRGSSHERGYGWQWQQLRKRILARDRGLCQQCLKAGKYRPARDVDHIVHKANGGTDDDSNLQSLCSACHKAKTAAEARHAQPE